MLPTPLVYAALGAGAIYFATKDKEPSKTAPPPTGNNDSTSDFYDVGKTPPTVNGGFAQVIDTAKQTMDTVQSWAKTAQDVMAWFDVK